MTFDAVIAYQTLHPHFHDRVRQDEPLARHSAFGVGGSADVWVVVETREELIKLVSLCAEQHWPLLVVGNGSNMLFHDAGARGIIAQIASASYNVERENSDEMMLVADAGVSWPVIAHECARQGWGGLEFGIGIPGTLAGAVVSNAGAHNKEIGEAVAWIEVLDARGVNEEGEDYSYPLIQRYQQRELDLSYRYSRFRLLRQARFDQQGCLVAPARYMIDPAEIILRIGLKVHREHPERVQAQLAHYQQERAGSEPIQPHRGSIFQDSPGGRAADLIAQAGMRGMRRGRAQIAEENANYIINLGSAKAVDILWLIEEAHRCVMAQSGIDLRPGIDYVAAVWLAQSTISSHITSSFR
jgi:UDP-N-acetylmuramate dehydrogenase